MSYAQGGLIEAVDYNNFLNGSNQLNTVWSTGAGAIGYGQTALSAVSAGGTVTATQWASLINTLNNMRNHQSGVGSGISATTAGSIVNYLSTLATQINTTYTNAALYATQGTTVTGSTFSLAVSSTTGVNTTFDRSVTFSSVQAARYFFNAGGQLTLVVGTNTSNGSGSSSSLARLFTGLGGVTVRNTTNTGRSGTGITLTTNNTAFGYRNLSFNNNTNIIQVTDTTAAYTADAASIGLFTDVNDSTSGANGSKVIFRIGYYVADHTWDDTISLNLTSRVDVTPPESTYLSNVWGTPTIA
jgi:hypothetical protein